MPIALQREDGIKPVGCLEGRTSLPEAEPAVSSIRGRYVMRERGGFWGYIPDTPEALAEAIRRGPMFATWCAFSHKPGGESEPIRYGNLPLDFDDKANPGNALDDLRRLCCRFLPEFLGIDPWDIQFFCSGSKGFHAIVPSKVFGLENGDPYVSLALNVEERGSEMLAWARDAWLLLHLWA